MGTAPYPAAPKIGFLPISDVRDVAPRMSSP